MKAIILAAGLGRRLRPMTLTTPKPLVLVAGKPLIIYHIEKLAVAGVRDIVINHHWLGDLIIDALGDGEQWGVNITYSMESELLETGGGILRALPLLTDDLLYGQFIVVNGDIISDYPLQELPATINGSAHLVMVDNPAFKPQGDFSLINGRISRDGAEPLTFSGISVLSAELFKGSTDGSFSLVPLLLQAMSEDNVLGEHYRGYWSDVGTFDRLEAAEKHMRKLNSC